MNAPLNAALLAPFGEDHGPHLSGVYAPVNAEQTLHNLPLLRGQIPTDLNGVYLRAGPNARFEPHGRYHPFDGDGMVHAAQFSKGQLTYRNRWIHTDGWQEEDLAQQATFYGIRETLKGRTDKRLKDTANTDVVGHAGKALALWYMAGDAYEIDPVTLQTLGKARGITATGKGISAHAKVDETTEELMFFDYSTEAPYMHYGVLSADGALQHHVPIDLPGPRLPHDMAITQHYSILHDLPLFHDADALALGRHKIRFHPEMHTRFGVIPRLGASDSIRWFSFTPCYLYHTVNAWEDGDWLVLVGCRYMPRTRADGSIDPEGTARDVAELVMRARLWCWRMNLATGETEEHVLNPDLNVEFPSCNARLAGRKTRYGYLVDHSSVTTLQWAGLRKMDLETGASLSAWTDDPVHSWYTEPWFAEADNATAEDHGYLIAFQWNEALQRQTLDIFDARDLSTGPVAQVELPARVPVGFHGCWIAERRLLYSAEKNLRSG
ncbi:carotenoid oxygenase family protein [Rhodoferax saidenbachensis]|uniref:Lignostilbene-alpha,beta-dioxygenase n=1 Tax=Rhodoferax saidenbachensis TaxID=1484693 RepID=A0A1P8KDZ3_9BURK|nr:carotenoid oxygenase family protein [Rhodoferax saidenbachensis]APW44250.1 lignostilbene-alpha,beta-dioxygenase [Rhodoferax saidenbachensis]